jgi:hypothetical protein
VPDLQDKATPVLWAVRVPISFSRAAASRPGPGARLHLRTAVLPGLLILATASFSAACFSLLWGQLAFEVMVPQRQSAHGHGRIGDCGCADLGPL